MQHVLRLVLISIYENVSSRGDQDYIVRGSEWDPLQLQQKQFRFSSKQERNKGWDSRGAALRAILQGALWRHWINEKYGTCKPGFPHWK